MKRFSDIFLHEIRERVPISDIIGLRVTWDRKKSRAGRGDWWACCPFHGENTSSFHCEDQKGRYHCFGCGVTGDHFRFLRDMDGVDFARAVEIVADKAGMALPHARPATAEDKAKAREWAKKREADRAAREAEKRREREEGARIANALVQASVIGTSAYLSGKGFPEERALTIDADQVRKIGGRYLVPEGGNKAVVMPARIGARITSVQLIWESGDKKFLAGAEIEGASHRIATGKALWLCEGFATGLSLRQALKALRINATVLCCFSASNVAAVARTIPGRCIIVADNDKPLEQFGGVGTGEHYARQTGKAFFMPPEIGEDLNDHHCKHGIFSVQRLITDFIREQRRAA